MYKTLSALLVTALVTPTAMALQVKGFSADLSQFSFHNDKGEATARDIFFEIGKVPSTARIMSRKPAPQNVAIYRDSGDIRIATGTIDFGWNRIPKWLTADLSLKAEELKLKLGYAPSNEISARTLTVKKTGLGTLDLNQLKILCTPHTNMNADFEKLLPQCLESAVVTSSEVSLPSIWEAIKDMGIDESIDQSENYQKVGNGLEVRVDGGKFNFKMNLATPILQKLIKLTVTAAGEIKLDEKTNVLRLRVEDARIKKLNLTRFIPVVAAVLFPQEVLRVQDGYLYLSLNDIKK